jgi:hypothetical protein
MSGNKPDSVFGAPIIDEIPGCRVPTLAIAPEWTRVEEQRETNHNIRCTIQVQDREWTPAAPKPLPNCRQRTYPSAVSI